MHECIFAFMHVVSTVSDLWRALVHFHLNFTSGALETKTNCSRCGKLRSVICLTTYNVYWWLDGETVERQTYDQKVVGSTPDRVTVKWLLLRRVTVYRHVNHLSI